MAQETFTYSGSVVTWTVPAGVTSVNIECQGAAGMKASDATNGKGGKSVGDLAVTPGTDYYLAVGGQSGVFGGGTGWAAAQGGDASWFSTANTYNRSTVIMVAGGGGASYTPSGAKGGDGGGTTGQDGTQGGASTQPGLGGTQSAGGAGALDSGESGDVDGQGTGGDTLDGNSCCGGAGYYGGGAGDWGTGVGSGGGGGGSGFLHADLTNDSTTQGGGPATGNGTIILTYTPAPFIPRIIFS